LTLIAVAANVHVSFCSTPMTLRVSAIMGLTVAFGASIGLGMVSAYLFEGTSGLPVFTRARERGIGVASVLGSTGGCLLGMTIRMWTMDRLAERRSTIGQIAAIPVDPALIYVFGLL
jgi:biotin transport system substrate-specific component